MEYNYERQEPVVHEHEHHHHHREKHHSGGGEESHTWRNYSFVGCCFILVLIMVAIVFAAPFFFRKVDNIDEHVHNHIQAQLKELSTIHTSRIGSKNSISLSSVFNPQPESDVASDAAGGGKKISRPRLDMCILQHLYTETNQYNATVNRFTQQIVDHIHEEVKQSLNMTNYYYIISMKMLLEFNVDTSRFQIKVPLDTKEKYMIVSYDISSSYPHFSTIKLIEIATDSRSHLLVQTNEVILCSNNPSILNNRLCSVPTSAEYSDQEAGNGNTVYTNQLSKDFFVKEDALFVTMSRGMPNDEYFKALDKQQQRLKNATHKQQDDKQFLLNKRIGIKYNFISDMRDYYVVFYREVKSSSSVNQQQSRIQNNLPYKEEAIFTITPTDCPKSNQDN